MMLLTLASMFLCQCHNVCMNKPLVFVKLNNWTKSVVANVQCVCDRTQMILCMIAHFTTNYMSM